MGCVGNLAISQVTPLMGAVYDSYTVVNLPAELKTASVDGKASAVAPPCLSST